MNQRVAVVGAGVSGLTCGILFAERGYRTAIFADKIGQQTTSAAAGAIWYPYDAKPIGKVIAWALETYEALVDLSRKSGTGVSMLELRMFSRSAEIQIPKWAAPLGARLVEPSVLRNGFVMNIPLMDTTIYLDYLTRRFAEAGGATTGNVRFEKLDEVDPKFDLVINCAGFGAKRLVEDADLEPHRGQVAIGPKIDLSYAVVCDDAPLMYAIPRTNDCLFGGTNELSEDRHSDPATTLRIIDECARVLKIDAPEVLAERVGIRPFRRSGVRLERAQLSDGRALIHNYGHGGAGFTLSWGCARQVYELSEDFR
ncbi:MAG: FAD-dependent oxidoreductase [Verrucomicrobiota bacterium]